jgi:hypothetical protein
MKTTISAVAAWKSLGHLLNTVALTHDDLRDFFIANVQNV